MKTLASLSTGLVLSLTLSAQAMPLQNTLAVESISKSLQVKIDQQLVYFLSDELKSERRSELFLTPKTEELKNDKIDHFLTPDCLCHLSTRVM